MAGKVRSGTLVALIVGLAFSGSAYADMPPSGNVVITSDTSWPEGAYQLDTLAVGNGAILTIAGGSTVTVSGAINVSGNSSILAQSKDNAAQVSGQWQGTGVTISAADVQIDSGSKIGADGQGYAGNNCSGAGAGPGGGPLNCNNAGNGGSHGGKGAGPNAASMTTYGSQFTPITLGSGGSGGYQSGSGGAGGGAIRLVVSGTLTNNGAISANGSDAGGISGAGAGGSIYATVGTLSGSGTFTANGGTGSYGGGGGRVAVYFQAGSGYSGFTGSTATGGAGSDDGTVIFSDNSQANLRLYVGKKFPIDNDTTATYDSITVDSGGTLSIGGGSNITVTNGITVTGNSTLLAQSKDNAAQVDSAWQGRGVTISAATVRVDAGSKISADGQGYAGNNCSGPGAGSGGGPLNCNNAGNGGSHGGKGAGPNAASMTTYGSQFAPTDPGSGGSGGFQSGYGGAGGGAIRLVVSGTLTNNGSISANGSDAGGVSGAGAGGSIFATVGTLTGSGIFTANGGTGNYGGGGGRVAVYYLAGGSYSGFTTSTATAGTGGGDGTFVFIDNSQPNYRLYINKLFSLNQDTVATYDSITVNNGGLLTVGGGSRITVLNGVTVTGNSAILAQARDNTAKVNSQWQGKGITISADNIRVDAGSRIHADGQGYAGNNCSGAGVGPGGAPLNCNNNGNGGSHGGKGAGPNAAGMTTYGSRFAPVDLGSGGSGGFQSGYAGSGGGAIRLLVAGTLTNDGTISANGNNAGGSSGGGAGGSIYASAGTLTGSGVFAANGGSSDSPGGGGRIAIYYLTNSGFNSSSVTASGGSGPTPGQAGTVVFSGDTPLFVWLKPESELLHGTVRLEGGALGLDVAATTVDVAVSSGSREYAVGTGLKILFGLDWDTSNAPDGQYEVRLTFRDTSGGVVREIIRTVAVNNSALWHSGVISSSQTWGADKVHVIEGALVISSGVQVTVQAGTVVKLTEGARIIVEEGGILDTTAATAGSRIVFTAVNDDSAGGDTTFDGNRSRPVPGSWSGIATQGSGRVDTNTSVDILYVRTDRSGTLAGSETWLGTYVYRITGDVIVPNGVTLTIQPGAVIKFDSLRAITVQPGGMLSALGTVAQQIYFTSVRDDSVGGDTNGDGNYTVPAAGDWRWINVEGATASFDHVQLLYGGGTGDSGALRTTGSSTATLRNSMIRDSLYDGALLEGGNVTVENSVFTGILRALNAWSGSQVRITNSTFDGNGTGVFYHGGVIDIDNTLITNSSQFGINFCCGSPAPHIAYSNVWSNAVNYNGMTDMTGQGGNISADPRYRNRQQHDYRLDYRSPAIDAADGTVAPATDLMGAPRYDDPRTANSGRAAANGAHADMGAYEFVEGASSDIDLTVSSVVGPGSANAGDQVTLSWTITNIGSGYAAGPWHDAVYLVRNPDTNPVEILAGETLVGSAVILGPGQSHTASATVRVPGSIIGAHRWKIKTNVRGEVFEGVNAGNNTAVSLDTVALDLPELAVNGAALSGQFTAPGQSHWFKVIPGPNKMVGTTLNLAGNAGTVQLYIGQGYLPDPQRYDFRQQEWSSSSANAVIPKSSTQIYYVTAHAGSLFSGTANFSITARSLNFSLGAVNPGSVNNYGSVTLELSGGLLSDSAVYRLVGPGGASRDAGYVFLDNPSHVYATFGMSGLALGNYAMQILQSGATVTLENAVSVSEASSGRIEYSIAVPVALRPGWSGQVTINYRNTGNTDATAPLMLLTADGARLNQIAPACTGCSPQFPLIYESIFNSGYVLGINHEGPAGILPPGSSGSITLNATPTIIGGNVSFTLNTIVSPDTPVDWASLKSVLRPYFVPTDAWEAVFANFTASAGTTIGQYNALLANNATYLSTLGRYEYSAGRLFSFELVKAGLPQVMRRYNLGAFGRGASHPYDIWAELRDGTPVIHTPAGTVREFFADPNNANQYKGSPGDYATLLHDNPGGTWQLTEKKGMLYHFVPAQDNPGRLILDYVQDLNGNRSTLSYTGGLLTGVANSSGDTWTYEYNPQGRIARITDPVGRAATYAYDANGEHLLSVTSSRGTTGFAYVTGSGPARAHALESITYPDGTHLFFEYDDRGRQTRRYRDGGAEAITFAYGSMGEVTISDAAGNSFLISADEYREIGEMTDAAGAVTRFSYDPEHKVVAVQAPLGATTAFAYDSKGNVSEKRDPSGNGQVMVFGSFGRLQSLANSLGNTLRYSYDGKYNVTGITYPDGNAQQASYDARGNLVQRINRRGASITYTYDAKNLLTRKTYSDGSHVDFAYDSHCNLLSAASSSWTTSFTYDSADRLTGITYPNGRSIQYSYDSGGRRTQMTDQSGFTVNYAYDSAGRLSTLTNGAGNTMVSYTYNANGSVARKDLGNGTYTIYTYDHGRLAQVAHHAANGSVNGSFTYAYDSLGRKTGMTSPDGTYSYAYDADGQLTSVTRNGAVYQYAYDAAGNRLTTGNSGATTGYSANSMDQYTAAGAASLVYDADGNLAAKSGGWSYSYDDDNRLVGMTGPAGTWTYEYDPFGNRVAQTHNGVRKEYLVDPAGIGNVIAEYDAAGALLRHYTYGLDLVSSVDTDGASYYNFDGSANTVQITGPAGNVLNSYSYLPFGEKINSTEAVSNPFTFVGQFGVIDEGNGLYSMRNRWYDPALGRFTQPDPLGIGGGDANLYRYVWNAPVNYTDPLGLEGEGTAGDAAREQAKANRELFEEEGYRTRNEHDQQMATGSNGIISMGVSVLTSGWNFGHWAWNMTVGQAVDYLAHEAWGAKNPPPDGWGPRAHEQMRVVSSQDPNSKVTVGYGDAGYIPAGTAILYTVHFENVASASAAAQKVVVTDRLDANLDWSSLELLQINFNKVTIDIPGGLQSYSAQAAVATDPNPVSVSGALDPATGIVTWTMQSVDPVTGGVPGDPFAGFLPPNDAQHRGEGYVTFRISPKAGLPNGTAMTNQATIVFDANDPIITNAVTNTMDNTDPTSSVNSLPAAGSAVSFSVSWGGNDAGGAGIAFYDVYVSIDGGGYTSWLTGTPLTSATFNGTSGHTYRFYSVATDNVGNRTAAAATAQATTTLPYFITGTVTGTSGSTVQCVSPVQPGSSSACTITPATGYHLSGLTDNGSNVLASVSGNTYTISGVAANHAIQASFAINTYTVSANAGSGGSISSEQAVNHGGTSTFTVTAASGYRIASVTGCGGTLSGSAYTTGAITGACTVSAAFTAIRDGILLPAPGKTGPDLGDTLKTLQFVVGLAALTDAEKIRVDLAPLGTDGKPAGNGVVDIADVVLMLRRVVGIVSW